MGLQELHYGTWQHSSEDYKANRQSDRRSTPLTCKCLCQLQSGQVFDHLLGLLVLACSAVSAAAAARRRGQHAAPSHKDDEGERVQNEAEADCVGGQGCYRLTRGPTGGPSPLYRA